MHTLKGQDLINRLLRIDLSEIKTRSEKTPNMPFIWDAIIVPAWHEIKFCFNHGLDWAVVLLSSALLEYAVKDRAFNIEYPNKGWGGREREKYFKKNSVDYAIKKCLEGKIIDKDEAQELKNICLKTRDQVSHMNILKLGKDKVFKDVPTLQKNTGVITHLKNVGSEDNPIVGKIAFWEKMNHLAVEIIEKCWNLLMSIYKNHIQKANEGKTGSAVFGEW